MFYFFKLAHISYRENKLLVMNHQEVEWINMGFQAFGSLNFNQMAWQYVII